MENPYVEPEFKDDNGMYYPTQEMMDSRKKPDEVPKDIGEPPSSRKYYNRMINGR
tara:strand:+ start:161 stop:325 length:165 start_codon:yes stop_codon:yes gene_type:complete